RRSLRSNASTAAGPEGDYGLPPMTVVDGCLEAEPGQVVCALVCGIRLVRLDRQACDAVDPAASGSEQIAFCPLDVDLHEVDPPRRNRIEQHVERQRGDPDELTLARPNVSEAVAPLVARQLPVRRPP